MAGMVGFYLYDSALLLHGNEALLSPASGGRWVACFGSDAFPVRGRDPFLPNPLLPHRPLYRFSWITEGLVGPSRPWGARRNVYAGLTPFIWVMMMALFVAIPLGLFTGLGNLAIAAGIILFYSTAMAALAVVWFRRKEYDLTPRRFLSLAFEWLTCPPFALNMVRHLSLASSPREDLLAVVDQCLEGAGRAKALKQIATRVRNEIYWEDEGTLRARILNSHLQYLISESDACQALNS